LYGLILSQFGDIKTELKNTDGTADEYRTVENFVKEYFGFERDFLGVVAVVVVAWTVLFAFIFAFSIKAFNFQRR